jgi:hypothetical protein
MTTKVDPCPFCEGPPVPIALDIVAKRVIYEGWGDDEGTTVEAYVFCHECGAQGPRHDKFIHDHEDAMQLTSKAVEDWNAAGRNNRHRRLYDWGDKDGLNLWPRNS